MIERDMEDLIAEYPDDFFLPDLLERATAVVC